jgi:thymidylate synthase
MDDLNLLGTDSDVEFPCTNDLHFMIRTYGQYDRDTLTDGHYDALDLHVSMRSNNMATTLVYDVFNFTMLQEYVARWLSFELARPIRLGTYRHHAASAHFFESQLPLVDALLADAPGDPFFARRDRGK